jgi:tetratricopeptide (TPR) repeat protein
MELQHPTSQDLQAFAGHALPRDGARAVVAHLLGGCQACRAEAAARWGFGDGPAVAPTPDSYDAVFARLAGTLRAGSPERVEALLQRAWELRHDRRDETLRLARAAALAASALSAAEWGAERVADVRCRAWAGLGNACRIHGDLDQAQAALDRAAEQLGTGTGDLLTRATLFDFQASLESARGNYEPAIAALDAAFAIHRERGDRHLAGRALISKGLQTAYAGRPREAFRLTQEGLALVDESRDPGLVVSALHNQLWFLLEGGRPGEARALLEAHRDRLGSGEAQRLDLLWLDGRIQAGLGELEAALRTLEAARHAFAAGGRRYQAASVKLDLAAVQLRLGDPSRALALVRATEEAFTDMDAPRTTLSAVSFLRRALAEREVPVQLVLRMADLVRRSQREAAGG